MNFEFEIDADSGRTRIAATPTGYDGRPLVTEVHYEFGPRSLSPDAKAVICYLLFRNYVGSEFVCPEPCSDYLATALARMHAHPLKVVGVSTDERDIQRPGQTVLLMDDGIGARYLEEQMPRTPRLRVISDAGVGRMVTKELTVFFSNAAVLANASTLDKTMNALAAVVLVSEDLHFDCVVLPITFWGVGGEAGLAVLKGLREILLCLDLRLETPLANVCETGLCAIDENLANGVRVTRAEEQLVKQYLETHAPQMLEALGGYQGDARSAGDTPRGATAHIADRLRTSLGTVAEAPDGFWAGVRANALDGYLAR